MQMDDAEVPPVSELLLMDSPDAAFHVVSLATRAKALRLARQWLSDSSPQVISLGLETLGRVAIDSADARAELFRRCDEDLAHPNVMVRRASARALGWLADEASLPRILSLLDNEDLEIRVEAAASLPMCVPDEAQSDHPAVQALLSLASSPEARLRDWAAAGLGSQISVDTPVIRDALRRLAAEVTEEGIDTAAEAAVGLAVRKDPAAYDVIAQHLTEDEVVHRLWVEAAGELEDPRLLPMLERLEAGSRLYDESWRADLHAAIARTRRSS